MGTEYCERTWHRQDRLRALQTDRIWSGRRFRRWRATASLTGRDPCTAPPNTWLFDLARPPTGTACNRGNNKCYSNATTDRIAADTQKFARWRRRVSHPIHAWFLGPTRVLPSEVKKVKGWVSGLELGQGEWASEVTTLWRYTNLFIIIILLEAWVCISMWLHIFF